LTEPSTEATISAAQPPTPSSNIKRPLGASHFLTPDFTGLGNKCRIKLTNLPGVRRTGGDLASSPPRLTTEQVPRMISSKTEPATAERLGQF
jgi:hypothetical protein